MNKSKIEWCDFTWNPVTGCYHGCEYCYARRIAHRFRNQDKESVETAKWMKDNRMVLESQSKDPYPCNFVPTFHKNRLDQPSKRKKPAKIFVSSMGDLFGEWVPDEWIEEVLEVVRQCPQHTFMFLTKNPKRYREFMLSDNCWIGTSISATANITRAWEILKLPLRFNTFFSIEPLLGPVDLKEYELLLKDWVIVGAQTGPGAVEPKNEWIESIIKQCKESNTPLFLKDNLNWPENIQEWPE